VPVGPPDKGGILTCPGGPLCPFLSFSFVQGRFFGNCKRVGVFFFVIVSRQNLLIRRFMTTCLFGPLIYFGWVSGCDKPLITTKAYVFSPPRGCHDFRLLYTHGFTQVRAGPFVLDAILGGTRWVGSPLFGTATAFSRFTLPRRHQSSRSRARRQARLRTLVYPPSITCTFHANALTFFLLFLFPFTDIESHPRFSRYPLPATNLVPSP